VSRIEFEASVKFQHSVRILRSVFACRPRRVAPRSSWPAAENASRISKASPQSPVAEFRWCLHRFP
jgi:hypothetical protein